MIGLVVGTLAISLGISSAVLPPFSPSRSVSLSEGWRFQPDPLRIGDAEHWESPDFDRRGWRPVAVPGAWDFYDPVMGGYEGVGWYALKLPSERVVPSRWQRLGFGRANHKATVWIDGKKAGENVTGYLPFEVPLTPYVSAGRPASIVVRVENGARWNWLPGAEVVEWVQYGGLLEPVELLTTAPAHLSRASLLAEPTGRDGVVKVAIDVDNAASAPFS